VVSEIGTTNIADGQWHYVAGTWDGSTVRVYVDGQEDGSGTSFKGKLRSNQNNSVFIGRSENFDPGYFNGTIDDVLIFNRALSAEQIKALFENKTNFIANEETALGDVWSVNVTPNSGQANTDGPTQQSEGMPIVDDSNLTIFDDGPKNCNEAVTIFANYTNTSGFSIVGASCNVTFVGDATIYGMDFNATSGLYFNDSKSLAAPGGTLEYNVSCNHTAYFAQEANGSDSIEGGNCAEAVVIPEFSTIGLILTIITIGLASVLIIRKKRNQ